MANQDQQPELRVTPIVGGPETEGVVSIQRLTADQLTESHVGKFMGCHDDDLGVNYQAKILKIRRFDTGQAPGVSIWVRRGQLPNRPSDEQRMHLRFETEIELVDLAAL